MSVTDSCFRLQTGVPQPAGVALVERKGWGHPDTLADHLAEELSRVYSRHTLEQFGAVLHHNFDKLALLGGSCDVWYGGGRMRDPVRVLVNGRATRQLGSALIPLDELIIETVRSFFSVRLPELVEHLSVELNVTSNASPGAVHGGQAVPERVSWFAPDSIDQLRERRALIANDTSLGTGWAPVDPVETFVVKLVDELSSPSEFTERHRWCGGDVKLMVVADDELFEAVLCVPQKSSHVGSRRQYVANCEQVLEHCYRQAEVRLSGWRVSFRLNARDVIEHDELYLTYTGSSIESGDEGVVGRGNRVNGLITPLRPMNLEGANGKNPTYHVGKLYNVAAMQIANRLHESFGGHVEVHLVSATGQALDRPWQTLVRMSDTTADEDKVRATVAEGLSDLPSLTREIIYGDVRLA